MSAPADWSAYIFDPDVQPPTDAAFYADFISEGDLVLWLGREKHRKTNVLLQLAICAALGRDFLRFRFVGRQDGLKVVYIDYESKPQSLKRRYDAICAAMKLGTEERTLLKANLRILQVRQMQREGKALPKFAVGKLKEQVGDAPYWRKLASALPADLYVIDPMRSLHAQDENDSKIEELLSEIRLIFRPATVVVAHHLRKREDSNAHTLKQNMREWSDSARGSGAIKAHSDVIVCQERIMDAEVEVLYVGAFLKDAADIEPIPLEESDNQSFYWVVRPDIPGYLRPSYDALHKAGGKFSGKNALVTVLVTAGINRKTAYKHIGDLKNLGSLVEHDDEWTVQAALMIPDEKDVLDEEVSVRNRQ